MNVVNLIGRPTRNPEIRYSGKGKEQTAVANFSLAVDNPFRKDKDNNADFIRIVAFGKTAEFIEKYVEQGVRIGLTGRIQTGSYEHEDGYTVYTTDIVASNIFFADGIKNNAPNEAPKSKGANNQKNARR